MKYEPLRKQINSNGIYSICRVVERRGETRREKKKKRKRKTMPKLKSIVKAYVSENTENIYIYIIIHIRNKIISSVVAFFLIFDEYISTQAKLKRKVIWVIR